MPKKKVAKKKTIGRKKPRTKKSGGTANTSTSFSNTPLEDIDEDVERFIKQPKTDILNLELLISSLQDNGDVLKIIDGSNGKDVIVWNDKTFTWDIRHDEGALIREWTAIVREMYRRVKKADLRHFDSTDMREAQRAKNACIKWLIDCQNVNKIYAVKRLAMVEDSLKIKPDALDADPMIVAVKNGYIDLKTQQLIKPSKSLYITKKMNVTYDKEAKAPKFEKFLGGIILSKCNEDKELRTDLDVIEFLYTWFGYAMTGRTTEHTLLYLYGDGINGKSVLWGTLDEIFGDYFGKVSNDVIVKSGGRGDESKASPQTASLKGKRLAVTSEPSSGQRLDDQAVKDLVSSEKLTARNLHRDPISFLPSHKILIVGNWELALDAPDKAMARRIMLLPMLADFTNCRDNSIEDSIRTEEEKSGILNLLLNGVKMYLDDVDKFGSIQQPQAIVEASKKYLEGENIPLQFINEYCNFGDGLQCSQQMLRAFYKQFCKREGFKAWSSKPLNKMLKRDPRIMECAGKNPSRWDGLEIKPELIDLDFCAGANTNDGTFPLFTNLDWHSPTEVNDTDFLWWCRYALKNHPNKMEKLKGEIGSDTHKTLVKVARTREFRFTA